MKKYTTESYSYYIEETERGTIRLRMLPLINWFKLEDRYFLIFKQRLFEEMDYLTTNVGCPEYFVQEKPVQLGDYWIYETSYLVGGSTRNPHLKKGLEFTKYYSPYEPLL